MFCYLSVITPVQLSVGYSCVSCKPWHQFLEEEKMCTYEILLQLRRIPRENLTDLDNAGRQALLKEFLQEKLDKDYYSNTRLKFM